MEMSVPSMRALASRSFPLLVKRKLRVFSAVGLWQGVAGLSSHRGDIGSVYYSVGSYIFTEV